MSLLIGLIAEERPALRAWVKAEKKRVKASSKPRPAHPKDCDCIPPPRKRGGK